MAHRFRDHLRHREAFAMRADVDLLGLIIDTPPPSEILDGVGIMQVRGPIDHHKNPLGVGESYERICEAFHELNDNPDVDAIVMCIDSPGGVVAGLNETVKALHDAKIKPVIAFVNEMATSAAYAISCVADEIVATRSAVAGSIGVISTMASQHRADEKAGIDFITIVSGARKADGHPHMPIDQGAIDAEESRVDELAAQFYELVKVTRGLEPKFSKSLEAGIFLGEEAVALGVVDSVQSYTDVMAHFSLAQLGADVYGSGTTQGDPMKVSLKALRAKIGTARASYNAETDPKKRTGARTALSSAVLSFRTNRMQLLQSALAKESDPTKRKAISAKISAVLGRINAGVTKTKYRLEEEETTEEDDEEEEEGNETDREETHEEGEEDDEEEEAAKAEGDESEPADDKEKKDKAKKATATAGRLAALEAEVTGLRGIVASVQARDALDARTSCLATALAAKRITPAESKDLAKKPQAYIDAFLEARPKSIVLTAEQALRPLPVGAGAIGRAEGGAPEAQVQLSAEQQKMLDDVADPKIREQIRTNWSARVNGAGGQH